MLQIATLEKGKNSQAKRLRGGRKKHAALANLLKMRAFSRLKLFVTPWQATHTYTGSGF